MRPKPPPNLLQPTGWNFTVARLKQLAQLKSLNITVVSLSIQPFLLAKLKQPARTQPSFVPASSGKREQSNPTRQLNNISLFIKFCLPGRKEDISVPEDWLVMLLCLESQLWSRSSVTPTCWTAGGAPPWCSLYSVGSLGKKIPSSWSLLP